VAYGTHSGRQLSPLAREKGSRFKWWHKIDEPTIQILTGEDSVFVELCWPERVRHRGSPAVGQCEDGEFDFKKAPATANTVSILRDKVEVGQIKMAIGRPSLITLSNGHGYSMRNEGYLREEWILVDENGESLFRIKRVFPDVEISGEVELLGDGLTDPPMTLLMMAAWYDVQ